MRNGCGAARVATQLETDIPSDREAFYAELTRRNCAFISPATQARLRKLRVLIAGCGSTGGACIESLARVGMEHFALADNGSYELNNLNRQHARLEDLGTNKAVFHGREVQKINPFAEVIVHPEGISEQNSSQLTEWADLVFDAIDVTTLSGIQMKVDLHAQAKRHEKPVLAGLDVGFRQWGRSYDYRDPETRLLDGKAEQVRQAKNPIQALFTLYPLNIVPYHCMKHVLELLQNPGVSASQLGCTSDLLSAIIVPVMIRFADTGELAPGWNINLEELALPWSTRLKQRWEGLFLRWRIEKLLRG